LERLTAAEFLTAKKRARNSDADKLAFTKLLKELQDTPRVRERLLFELLAVTSNTLEQGASPRGSLADALQFTLALSQERTLDYISQMEKIISSSSRLLGQAGAGTGSFTAFELTLAVALTELRRRSPERFKAAWRSLGYPKDLRSRLLDKVAASLD
jgi:hypothetical protein